MIAFPCHLAGREHERAADHLAGSPAEVFAAFIELTASGELVRATGQTIWPFAIGLVVAFVVGTALGLLLGIFRPAARMLDPYIFVFWSIPNIAWLPLFIAWFGVGNLTLIVFVFVSAVFPQLLTVEAGAKEADSFLVEVARSLGGTKREILRLVVLPSALPYIFAGLRIAVGRALVGIIVGQLLIVATGIGYMFQFYGETLSLAKYFAPLIVIAALAVAAQSRRELGGARLYSVEAARLLLTAHCRKSVPAPALHELPGQAWQ